jgi:hypothetical protein
MTLALDRLLEQIPAPHNTDELWREAAGAPFLTASPHGGKPESPAARMRRMRDALQGELVAFHDALIAAPYKGDLEVTAEGGALWDVRIPLTLFPRRAHGFSRVECLVEFSTGGGEVRVLALAPAARSQVVARAEMGGNLELSTKAKLGLPMPFPLGTSVVEAAGAVYAQAEAGPFLYEAVRSCVATDIVRGTSGRWRLDDAGDPGRVGVESHELRVVLEVGRGAGPVHAAGYLQAYSDMGWMSAELGSVWSALAERIKVFFRRGAPAEAYAEWERVIPGADGAATAQGGG